jgi:hypothetical protein
MAGSFGVAMEAQASMRGTRDRGAVCGGLLLVDAPAN